MKTHLIFGIFTAVCISNAVSQLDPSMKQEIDDLIKDEYFTKGKISAIGLAIVKDGEVLYTNGYGYRDIENSIPADSSTLFFIGSISKVQNWKVHFINHIIAEKKFACRVSLLQWLLSCCRRSFQS